MTSIITGIRWRPLYASFLNCQYTTHNSACILFLWWNANFDGSKILIFAVAKRLAVNNKIRVGTISIEFTF